MSLCENLACELQGTMKCASCKTALYCCKDCQVRDWKRHKKACKQITEVQKNVPPSFMNLQIVVMEELSLPPLGFPSAYSIQQGRCVESGEILLSNKSLFTHTCENCVVLGLWGQEHVLLSHLSLDQALSVMSAEEEYGIALPAKLKKNIPKDFKFKTGVLIPGPEFDLSLCSTCKSVSKGQSKAIAYLLKKELNTLSFGKEVFIGKGVEAGYIVEARVQAPLFNIFKDPRRNLYDHKDDAPDCSVC